ncbi:Flap endonuclease GEN-like protein 1 [Psilocybe cubensis]|uniref:Flap endonuclease GEN-like protein 1 n=2 Tax=Psilocybe cubensis TaxID=181762 RepID=A0ACB8HDN4_PSICU|nr:Flap endonuclease GEN-like protein 1 [Psilocybe cubensis]KAH9485284.1 Flap endonuclease GEN-like protein 1 [Psilocybe cubensis]
MNEVKGSFDQALTRKRVQNQSQQRLAREVTLRDFNSHNVSSEIYKLDIIKLGAAALTGQLLSAHSSARIGKNTHCSMGVPGLWDVLNKVGKSTSIVRLSVHEGFDKNQSRRRAYRIGVDASIWFHHATFSKQGENPEARGLFFRLIYLAKLPIIPLFVFDGRERPKIKASSHGNACSKMGKSGNHPREKQFKHLLDAFGMEWCEARGEAEAELAYLNDRGHIDAVMTDDCDAFLFGARTIIKNISSRLSGNKNNLAKNSKDKVDKFHTMIYQADDIENDPSTSLSRGDLILFALLAGGDYHKGVERMGKKIALGLARCGFGKELLEAYQNLRDYRTEFEEFMRQWRMRVNIELKHNTQGHLPHRTSLFLSDDFPNPDVLEFYANPLNSGSAGGQGSGSMAIRDQSNLDLPKIAHVCEQYFEWGYRAKIIERFRNLIWPCAVMHVLRRAALEVDRRNENISNITRCGSQGDIGTPASLVERYLCSSPVREGHYDDLFVNKGSSSKLLVTPAVDNPLVNRIIKSRQHVSTDGLLEYQVEISPKQLIQLSNSGIKGIRHAPVTAAETGYPNKGSETDPLILWVPAVILSVVHPTMVKQFNEENAKKSSKLKGKNKGRANEQERTDQTAESASEGENMLSVLQSSKLQKRSRPEPRAVGQNSYTEVLKPTYATEGIDPWFTSNSTSQGCPTLSRNSTSGFLFTIPNPDENELELERADYDNEIDCLASYDSEVSHSTSKFEQIIDGILTKKRKLAKDPKRPRKPEAHTNMTDERPSKKRQVSSLVLDALDGVEFR